VLLVADTHTLVWNLTTPRKLGREAARAFEAADDGRWLCCVPAIVLVELSLLYERGRAAIRPADVLRVLRGRAGYAVLALDVEQALAVEAFGGITDPMDRMILAAAHVGAAKLVSVDPVFDGLGVERVWD
jgi:PIN domain nuclease of toxin-antitoxin system